MAAPPTKRARPSPYSTRAGKASDAHRRASAPTSSGASEASSTAFPKRRPLSTDGSATRASSAKAAAKLASCVRRKSKGAPSARFAVYSPPGRSTRAASRAYSSEVSCAGTREPPNTSATTTSALSEGAASSQARASAVCTVIPAPSGSGRCSETSATRPASNSTTDCRDPALVAAA